MPAQPNSLDGQSIDNNYMEKRKFITTVDIEEIETKANQTEDFEKMSPVVRWPIHSKGQRRTGKIK